MQLLSRHSSSRLSSASLAGGVLSATLALALLPSPGAAQVPCANFTYVKTSTVDPNWPDSLTNGFGYHQYMTQPLSAQLARGCVQVPAGFSTHLWASEEPTLSGTRSLVAMNWDEKGRLWGVETRDYPNRVLTNPMPGGGGTDRIVILEDTNGDGIADTRKVFAEGFNLLTGIVVTVDGIVVSMAPHILLLKDENGDDVPDSAARIIYTGFGRSDTHATISHLTYGVDNWIYATIGYSGGTGINNPGTGQTFSGGWGQRILRFKSDGTSIQSLTALSNNAWGIGISETGQIFASTANRDHSEHQVFPGQAHKTPIYAGVDQSYVAEAGSNPAWAHPHPVTRHVNINNGGYPATSNHSLYTARQFPQRYWDRIAFTCDAPHHLCTEVILSPYKSTWRAAEDTLHPNVFASTDPWSAPIQAHAGPDGALWVLDWYNYLNNHNGVCGKIACGPGAAQISPVRDTLKTRVYRIVYDARPLDPILNLKTATEDQLLAAFNHTNLLWRLHAQRLLLKRGPNAGLIQKLNTLLASRDVNDMGESPQVIHALRTLEGFGLFATDSTTWVPVLKGLLLHPSAGVRWNALDALPITGASAYAILDQGRINDPDAHVRVRALYKLSLLPGTKSGAMYTPFVTLDTYSQARFTAVSGLAQSATMPATPPLQTATALRDGRQMDRRMGGEIFAGMAVRYRGGSLEIRGLDASVSGVLTVWNMAGVQVARVPVAQGRVSAGTSLAHVGVHTFRMDIEKGPSHTGRFAVISDR